MIRVPENICYNARSHDYYKMVTAWNIFDFLAISTWNLVKWNVINVFWNFISCIANRSNNVTQFFYFLRDLRFWRQWRWNVVFSGLLCSVMSSLNTIVSENSAELRFCSWWDHGPPKRWYSKTTLHGTTTPPPKNTNPSMLYFQKEWKIFYTKTVFHFPEGTKDSQWRASVWYIRSPPEIPSI